jgi:HK97 family phage prohead protease
MPKDTVQLPLIGRNAEVRPDSIDREARTIEVVWTTGATVQRVRWEGWDDRVEYDEELVVDEGSVRLERLNAGAPFLNAHSAYRVENVLGVVVPGSARIEGGMGYATIQLTDASDAADIVQRILEKTLRNVSVGYQVHRYEITKKDGQREHWRAVDWEPMEISAVAIGADPGSQVRSGVSQSAAVNTCVLIRQDDNAAAAATDEGKNMTDKTTAAAATNADNTRAADPADTTRAADTAVQTRAADNAGAGTTQQVNADAIRAEERQRAADINALGQRHGLDGAFTADLIARGVSIDAARAAILDKLASNDPAGRVAERAPAQARDGGTQEVAYRDALTNALMHRHNPSAHQLSDDGREFRGMSLIEMGRAALERRGVNTRGMSKMELAGEVFSMRSAGMHSTSDFPAILANVAGKTLRAAYDSTQRTFTTFARRATITDFKPVSRAQLGGAPDLQKVLENGEFKYGDIGEGKEGYALATYGRIVAITRQTLINDDLDAFTRVPASFGAAAADLESDIVYQILMQNPNMADGTPLFHADHGNLGTASVISEAALAAAYRAFGKQKGLEKRLISILPRFILVPPGVRSIEARKQVTATTPNSSADVNTFAGRLEVIEEPRLIPASGQDPWFLAADAARIDTIEYAYLDGQEGVYTETRTGFEVDGLEIKARHDFAAKAIDSKGIYKNPGAAPA